MLAGMIAPEKPPLRIAKSTSSRFSLRTSKFGPLVRSPAATWPVGLDPRASAAPSVWHPPQRWWKSCAPLWTVTSLFGGASSVPCPQPANAAARAASEQARIRGGRRMAAHIIRGRVTRALTLGLAAAIGLAGWGGSDGGGGKSLTVPAGKPVAVSATEYRVNPKT